MLLQDGHAGWGTRVCAQVIRLPPLACVTESQEHGPPLVEEDVHSMSPGTLPAPQQAPGHTSHVTDEVSIGHGEPDALFCCLTMKWFHLVWFYSERK